MKKYTYLLLLVFGLTISGFAQRYELKDAKTSFFSKTSIEDIEAKTKDTKGIIDAKANTFYFKVPIKTFEFKSGLMRDHFNENYMESEKFPYATFKGKIEGPYDMTKDGFYMVKAVGELTIHGEIQNVSIPSKITVTGGVPSLESTFKVKLVDYKITIPTVVFNKIAEEIEVSIGSSLGELK
jgi:hypothetical protein